jgi:TetR/AcrR family transcriptional repressor of nem operon
MANVEAKRTVGRPREFNEERALEAAMDIFWQKGFEATSMTDLCSCTGLHKGSLYQAFGDKHQLFLRALKHYADLEFKEIAAVAYQFDSPLESIRAIVREVCNQAEEGRGCLIINSLVELAPHDPEVKNMILDEGKRRVRVMGELLAKAQERGEIRAALDPSILARQLMISLAGSAALVKGLITTDEVLQLVDNMIDLWT